MDINQYTVVFKASEVENNIALLCDFIAKVKNDGELLISDEVRAAMYQLNDLLCLHSNLLQIDHYRLNRGDIILRRSNMKDCQDCDFVCFSGVCFKVVLYL